MRIASDEDRPSSGRGRARHRVACPTNHKPHLFQIPPSLTLSPPTTLTPRPYPKSPAATRSISTRSTACDCWSARCAAARDPTTARGPRPASTSATARRGPRPCFASCASARPRRRSRSTTRATSRGIPRWPRRSTSTRRNSYRARARAAEPRWWARSSRSCANPRRDPTQPRRALITRTPRSRVRSHPRPGPRRASYKPRAGPPRRPGAEPLPALARPRSRVCLARPRLRSRVPSRRTRSRWRPRSSNPSARQASSAPSRRRNPGGFKRSNPGNPGGQSSHTQL